MDIIKNRQMLLQLHDEYWNWIKEEYGISTYKYMFRNFRNFGTIYWGDCDKDMLLTFYNEDTKRGSIPDDCGAYLSDVVEFINEEKRN